MLGYDDIIRDAETRLVGAALLSPVVVAESGLEPLHFHDYNLQAIWGTLKGLRGSKDPVFDVADVLQSEGLLEACGGLSGLGALTLEGCSSEVVPALASKVRQAYTDRAYAVQLSEQLERLRNGSHAVDLFGSHLDRVDNLRRSGAARSQATAADLVQAELEAIEHEIEHPDDVPSRLELPWRLGAVCPGGLPPDKLTVLFGPTGGFKSTIANGIARHVAQTITEGVVVKFGLEDSAVLEAQKLVAGVSGVSLDRIVNRDLDKSARARLRKVGAEWLTRLIIVDDVVPTADEMIRAYRAIDGVRAVLYDYIQLIDWEGEQERIAIHKFCVRAQRAAKADRVAHVALSQLREDLMDAADPADKRPRMQWLFGGSATKNTSKLIVGVYRPWSYFPNPADLPRDDALRYGQWARDNPNDWERLIELVIRKNQLGPINVTVPVLVDLETGLVEEFNP